MVNSHKTNFSLFLTGLLLFVAKSSCIENDENYLFIRAQVDGLKLQMNDLVNQLTEEKILGQNLKAQNFELETKISRLVAENAEQNKRVDRLQTELKAHIHLSMTQSTKQDEDIRLLKKINDDIITSKPREENIRANIASNENGFDSDSSPRIPPSSCRQLSTVGHFLDGIYLVANPDTNKIEAVYCDFGSSTLSETLFGSVDVKSTSVHFYVQRSSDFALTNADIPFDIARLNIGGAMNLASGVFTVPVDGIYHFEFSGLRDAYDATPIGITLGVNGVGIGNCYGEGIPNYFLPLSGISASLQLKTGDQITLFKTGGTLNDDGAHWTHFTGWLVEENLVLG